MLVLVTASRIKTVSMSTVTLRHVLGFIMFVVVEKNAESTERSRLS